MDTKVIATGALALVLGAGGASMLQSTESDGVILDQIVSEYRNEKQQQVAWEAAIESDNRKDAARAEVAKRFQPLLDNAKTVEERAALIEQLTIEANKAADSI